MNLLILSVKLEVSTEKSNQQNMVRLDELGNFRIFHKIFGSSLITSQFQKSLILPQNTAIKNEIISIDKAKTRFECGVDEMTKNKTIITCQRRKIWTFHCKKDLSNLSIIV